MYNRILWYPLVYTLCSNQEQDPRFITYGTPHLYSLHGGGRGGKVGLGRLVMERKSE